MISFDLWQEAFIFGSVLALIILVPCFLVTLIGRKMLTQLGERPSNTPIIQLKYFLPLALIEVVTFAAILFFYRANT